MPGERRTAGRRTRGSWLPTLAGLGAVVVLVGGGTAAYLIEVHPAKHHGNATLPTKVISLESVGLVAEPGQAASATTTIMQLLGSPGGPAFAPVTQAQINDGQPQWTADFMAGGTYIFIFVPTGQCLASAGSASAARLAVLRCDLGLAQRWQRLGAGAVQSGHEFYQFRNAASGRCLAETGSGAGQTGTAGLTSCDPSQPTSQMLSFWWTSQ